MIKLSTWFSKISYIFSLTLTQFCGCQADNGKTELQFFPKNNKTSFNQTFTLS